jgi:hypothetical protein
MREEIHSFIHTLARPFFPFPPRFWPFGAFFGDLHPSRHPPHALPAEFSAGDRSATCAQAGTRNRCCAKSQGGFLVPLLHGPQRLTPTGAQSLRSWWSRPPPPENSGDGPHPWPGIMFTERQRSPACLPGRACTWCRVTARPLRRVFFACGQPRRTPANLAHLPLQILHPPLQTLHLPLQNLHTEPVLRTQPMNQALAAIDKPEPKTPATHRASCGILAASRKTR